eukprot:TRINITY_DN28537_c0_g1_i2.p2 TRINITY_DN28537_c0_g1~~TRINITY_DN28537_c0_g1_i2.p2  ORF type:complete len:191 (+),score=24.39 TRINITY_DN28537_c0_g1_i2:1188-1760(+)
MAVPADDIEGFILEHVGNRIHPIFGTEEAPAFGPHITVEALTKCFSELLAAPGGARTPRAGGENCSWPDCEWCVCRPHRIGTLHPDGAYNETAAPTRCACPTQCTGLCLRCKQVTSEFNKFRRRKSPLQRTSKSRRVPLDPFCYDMTAGPLSSYPAASCPEQSRYESRSEAPRFTLPDFYGSRGTGPACF